MAQQVDATERRARRYRLIIILVVAFVILGGGLVWHRLQTRALDQKADVAISELKHEWQSIDLTNLNFQYARATTDAWDTGDYSNSLNLFPHASKAEFSGAVFDSRGVVRATYSINAWGGGHECLSVLVTGPTPNRVAFQRHSHGC